MKILARKQVGPIYYMVNDIPVLEQIVEQGLIRTSIKAEPTGTGNGSHHYISFMRDLTKADRNPNRWVYGLQLDGDLLSDRYKISPYSFAGNAMKKNYYRLKTLTAYDDGSFKVNIVNWPPIDIPEFVFKELEEMIKSDSQGLNDKKKLQVAEGSRSYRGKKATIRYNYNVKTGGIVLNESTLSDQSLDYLLKHTNLNETEERIWIIDDSTRYININNSITGYISPKGDKSVEKAIQDGELPERKVIYY